VNFPAWRESHVTIRCSWLQDMDYSWPRLARAWNPCRSWNLGQIFQSCCWDGCGQGWGSWLWRCQLQFISFLL
jgi:hypothetical protein